MFALEMTLAALRVLSQAVPSTFGCYSKHVGSRNDMVKPRCDTLSLGVNIVSIADDIMSTRDGYGY